MRAFTQISHNLPPYLTISIIFMSVDLLEDLDDLSPHGLLDFTAMQMTSEWQEEEKRRLSNFQAMPLPSITKIDDKLKQSIRKGIPCSYRRKIWFIASGGRDLYMKSGVCWDDLVAVAASVPDIDDIFFGSKIELFNYLPVDGIKQVVQFMKVVYYQNRAIKYAPMITAISLLLLLFMEPPMAYWSIQAMIEKSQTMGWYIATNAELFNASVHVIRDIACQTCKNVIMHAEKILNMSIGEMWMPYIPTFFLPLVPLPAVLTIFDAFVSEGRKILNRICVAILASERDLLMKATTVNSFFDIVGRAFERLIAVPVLHEVMKKGFNVTMSRTKQRKMEGKFIRKGGYRTLQVSRKIEIHEFRRGSMPGVDPVVKECRPEAATYYPGTLLCSCRFLALAPECQVQSAGTVKGGALLTSNLFTLLKRYMAPELRCLDALLVFNMTELGTCFSTLQERGKPPGYYILIIQTSTRRVGSVLSDSIGTAKRGYFGRGSTFVFDASELAVYRRRPAPNHLFISVSKEDLIIGGPEPAIYLCDQFQRLQSQTCETFGSPPLAESKFGDDIYEIELYRLQRISV